VKASKLGEIAFTPLKEPPVAELRRMSSPDRWKTTIDQPFGSVPSSETDPPRVVPDFALIVISDGVCLFVLRSVVTVAPPTVNVSFVAVPPGNAPASAVGAVLVVVVPGTGAKQALPTAF
jgi:hypothetical protein